MNIEEIRLALYKADLQIRPYALFVNPLDAEIIKEIPHIKDIVVIQEVEVIERGKAYLIRREDLQPVKF